MTIYFFWDIENVSFHNLKRIMEHVNSASKQAGNSILKIFLFAVYSRIKESRKIELTENGWELVLTAGAARNSADLKIKEMINSILDNKAAETGKIFLITEDRGFYKISQRIISSGIQLEIICGTKNPQWIKDLKLPQQI